MMFYFLLERKGGGIERRGEIRRKVARRRREIGRNGNRREAKEKEMGMERK